MNCNNVMFVTIFVMFNSVVIILQNIQQLRNTVNRSQTFSNKLGDLQSTPLIRHQGRVQQLNSLSIGPAYVRLVSCWTAFIVIQ